MARYLNDLSAGEVDTNVFDTNLLSSLLRSAPQGAQLSEDGKNLSYDFDLFNNFLFHSNDGFSAPWVGTINSIASISGIHILSAGNGFSADAAAVHAAIEDGDTAALNALFWSGNDLLTGSASDDTLRGFAGRDVLFGDTGNDTLIGDEGNDRLLGGSGDDNIFGGAGNDRLGGGSGNDVIVGGAGNDLIVGNGGGDSLTGGTGADTFLYRSIGQLIGKSEENITDFSHAQGDKIDLMLIDADTTTAGDQAFTYIDNTHDTLTGTPAAGSLVIDATATADTYTVSLYTDGTGQHLSFLVTAHGGFPTADDFML